MLANGSFNLTKSEFYPSW